MASEEAIVNEMDVDIDINQNNNNNKEDESKEIDLDSKYAHDVLADLDSRKPARSGYMFFASEERKKVVSRGPVAEQSKRISTAWNALSDEERLEWNEKVKNQKKEYDEYLVANPEKQRILFLHQQSKKVKKNNEGISFPMATIKKMIMRDPDISRISKEALVLVGHCTTLFIADLAKRVNEDETERRGSKTMTEQDMIETLHSNSKYMFIRHVFKKNKDSVIGQKRSNINAALSNEPPKKRIKTNQKKVDGANSITRFFKK